MHSEVNDCTSFATPIVLSTVVVDGIEEHENSKGDINHGQEC